MGVGRGIECLSWNFGKSCAAGVLPSYLGGVWTLQLVSMDERFLIMKNT